jgi:peptidoglycan/LPS O-acetylase OafA/YrhL
VTPVAAGAENPPRVPALDALRALAILLILAEHARGAYLQADGLASVLTRSPVVRGGWSGIDLAFVLAGHLAGVALFGELARRGTIDVKRFLARRALGAAPLYLALYLAVSLFGPGALHRDAWWWPDPTFTTNYAGHGQIPGSWVVATAAQFHLVAPLLVLAAAPRLGPARAGRLVLTGALLFFPLARALTWWSVAGSLSHHDSGLFVEHLYRPFHLHADGLFVGLALSVPAALRREGPASSRARPSWWIAVGVALFGALSVASREAFLFSAVALLAAGAVRLVASPRLAFLGAGPARVLARLSFGMYLNHRLLEDAVSRACLDRLPLGARLPALHFAATYGVLVLASALIAAVTRLVIELPLRRLRDRIASPI